MTNQRISDTYTYHGHEIWHHSFINILAREVYSQVDPIIGSDEEREQLLPYIEHLGQTNLKIPGQLALVVFYCGEEDAWFKMNIEQLKEYWQTKKLATANLMLLEEEGLADRVRDTAYGPDILGMIQQPFAVVKQKSNDITAVFD